MKANLARFTWALMLLAIMALSIGAGMRLGLGMKTFFKGQAFRSSSHS